MPRDVDAVARSVRALHLLAVDALGIGGVRVRGDAAAVTAWATAVARLVSPSHALRILPSTITLDRLLGGIDLAAALSSGRTVVRRGVLAEANGGVMLARRASGLDPECAAVLARVIDDGAVAIERDGITARHEARVALVIEANDERLSAALADRVPWSVTLPARGNDVTLTNADVVRVEAARLALATLSAPAVMLSALAEAADALGVSSVRAVRVAWRLACACAVLDGRGALAECDLADALAMVCGGAEPLETAATVSEERGASDRHPHERPDRDGAAAAESATAGPNDMTPSAMAERVIDAVRVLVPADVLSHRSKLVVRARLRQRGAGEGREYLARAGRPRGARTGAMRSGDRLHFLATLRAAAPFQSTRRTRQTTEAAPRAVIVAPRDLRVRTLVARPPLTVVFVVDASGSMALRRMAEAKGAVQQLLTEGYARRDRVALIAFQGRGARVLLPPTRAPARARRALAALPGGGGTPLAAALDAAHDAVRAAGREGRTVVVLITDGHANVARDGSPGRTQAEADARKAARRLASTPAHAVLIDPGARPSALVRQLAQDLRARHVSLPALTSQRLAAAVGGAMAEARLA